MKTLTESRKQKQEGEVEVTQKRPTKFDKGSYILQKSKRLNKTHGKDQQCCANTLLQIIVRGQE